MPARRKGPGEKKVRVIFFIDPDLRRGLRILKAREGLSEAEQIRRALRPWLSRRGALKDGGMRRGKNG